MLGNRIALFIHADAGAVHDARADLSAAEFVVDELRRVEDARCHCTGEGERVGERVARFGRREGADRVEDGVRFGCEVCASFGNDGVGGHIRRAHRVFDGAAGDAAGDDDIVRGGGVIGLGVTNDVVDVRLERHLQIGGGGQMSTSRFGVERMREQSDAGLFPDFEIVVFERLNQIHNRQHFGEIHRVRKSWRAVEHHLRDVIFHAERARVVGGEKGRDHEDRVRRVAHAPMMRLVEFDGDVVFAVPLHHFLMFADGTLEVPWAAAVHLVEPEKRNGTPGDVDRVHIHFGEADEIVGAGVSAQEREVAASARLIERTVIIFRAHGDSARAFSSWVLPFGMVEIFLRILVNAERDHIEGLGLGDLFDACKRIFHCGQAEMMTQDRIR